MQSVLDESDAAFRSLVAAFDEKERYIDSLPSVRAKRWILGKFRTARPDRGDGTGARVALLPSSAGQGTLVTREEMAAIS